MYYLAMSLIGDAVFLDLHGLGHRHLSYVCSANGGNMHPYMHKGRRLPVLPPPCDARHPTVAFSRIWDV